MYDIGDRREAVRELQSYLLEISYSDTDIPKVSVDGDFSERTTEAVLAFQRKKGVSPTGVVDYETWTLIAEEYLRVRRARDLDDDPMIPAELPLGVGAVGHHVTVLQSAVNQLADVYRELPPLAVSGNYRSGTSYSVSLLQRRYGLPETGITDNETWFRIMNDMRTRSLLSSELNQ